MKEENIIKKVCKELGITYKQLGEKIGISESSLRSAASTGKISKQLQKAIELYLENLELKKELEEFQELKEMLKKWTS